MDILKLADYFYKLSSLSFERAVVEFFSKYPRLEQFGCEIVEADYESDQEATQRGDKILIFPKFWELDLGTQDFVMAHEIGHYFLGTVGGVGVIVDKLQELGVDAWDVMSLPYGQMNMEEAFCDCFAVYFINQEELVSRYPEWKLLIDKLMLSKDKSNNWE